MNDQGDAEANTYQVVGFTLQRNAGNVVTFGPDLEGIQVNADDQNNAIDLIGFAFGSATINAGAGQDTLVGTIDNDVLNGQDGNDQLTGSAGGDALTGGNQTDTLVESGDVSY